MKTGYCPHCKEDIVFLPDEAEGNSVIHDESDSDFVEHSYIRAGSTHRYVIELRDK